MSIEEAKTLDSFARLAVARASGDPQLIAKAHGRLWEHGSCLIRLVRGEALSALLTAGHNVVSSNLTIVHVFNYFAIMNGVEFRARPTPLAEVSA